VKGKKPPSLTIEEVADSLFDAEELAQIRQEYGLGDEDEQTAVLTPESRATFQRINEKQKRIGCLIVLTGEESGKVLQLQDNESVLGRSKNATLPLVGHGISRFHATVKKRPGVRGESAYFVEDMQSKNGTFVNGQAAVRPTALRDGDLLTLGGAFLLKFKQIDNAYLTARKEGQISQIRGGVLQINDRKQVTFINQYARDALQAGPWLSPEDLYELALKNQMIRQLEVFPDHDDIEVWQTQVDRSLYRCHGIPLFNPTGESDLHEAHGAIFMFMDASLDSMLEREMNLVSQQLLVASQRANVARRAAEQANQAKSEFLARMRHELLVDCLDHIRRFQGLVAVIRVDGEAQSRQDLRAELVRDLLLLQRAGLRPVLVHGSGGDVERSLHRMGAPVEEQEGAPVTRGEATQVVEATLAGRTNKDLVALIHRLGGRAVGLSGKDGELIRARRLERGADNSETSAAGVVDAVNPELLGVLERSGYLPVVAPIGIGPDGETVTLSADQVAAHLAVALGAGKLIFVADTPGLVEEGTTHITSMKAREAQRLLDTSKIEAADLQRLRAGLHAVSGGVLRVQVVDGRVPHHVVGELFTSSGVGTMIVGE